jgi:carbamate kinase
MKTTYCAIERMNIRAARKLLESGEFPLGSMGPKVEAALNYLQDTGCRALITDLEHLEKALKGRGRNLGRALR